MDIQSEQAPAKLSEVLASSDDRRQAGFRRADEREAQIAARQRELEQGRREEAWLKLVGQFGKRYQQCTLDGFDLSEDPTHAKSQRAVLKAMRRIEEIIRNGDNIPGMLLLGPRGTGKDHLAFALMRIASVERGISIEWRDGCRLFSEIRDEMDDAKQRETKLVNTLAAPGLLVLSDPLPPFGRLTQWQSTKLFEVIDTRYRNMKPTFVTLNVSGEEEANERIGATIVDRLFDGAVVCRCNWTTHRKELALVG